MKKPRHLPIGTFFSTLVLSFCVLGLGALFLLIDCNMQRTMTGQVVPPATFSLEEGCPVFTTRDGKELSVLSPTRNRLDAFWGAPVRAIWWLIRREQAAVCALLDHLAAP